MIPALALGLLGFGPGGYWSATWLSKWFLLMVVGAGYFSWGVAKRTSLWHLPLLLYAFGSLLWLAAWPWAYEGKVETVTLLALQKNALVGLAELVVCLGLFVSARKYRAWGAAVVWASGVGFLLLPATGPSSPPNNGLWFGNPSMAGGLIACLLPIVWGYSETLVFRVATWLVTFAVVIRTGASIPWGCLGVVTAAFLASWKYKKAWFLNGLAIPLLAIGMIFIGRKLLGAEFWDQNGRFEIWGMAWAWFRTHGNLWLGMGFSSSQTLLPLEQMITGHFHDSYFLWLHNDWLQLMIEGGIVGILCVVLSVGRLLYAAWGRSDLLFASLAGFCTLACFNYPLRMPIHCFCLVLVCGMIEAHKEAAE